MEKDNRRLRLRELIESGNTTVVPGVFDAVSAKIIENTGYPLTYIGSYSTSAVKLGQPDIGCLTLTEMVNHAKSVIEAVSIPVIVDAEDGFFDAPNIWRTVSEFEKIGAAAIHIEDHISGKHTNLPIKVTDTKKMCNKIKAAVEARIDSSFLIIARTDTMLQSNNINEAIKRVNSYLDSGADLVFLSGTNPEVIKSCRNLINGPVIITNSPTFTVEDEKDAKINLVIYYSLAMFAAYKAVKDVAEEFYHIKDYNLLSEKLMKEEQFNQYISYEGFINKSKIY